MLNSYSPCIDCMVLDRPYHFSEPQFPCLKTEVNDKTDLMGCFEGKVKKKKKKSIKPFPNDRNINFYDM